MYLPFITSIFLKPSHNTSYWNPRWDSIEANGSWAPYTTSISTTFNNTIPLKSRAALHQIQINEQWNLVGSMKWDLTCPRCDTHSISLQNYKGRKDQRVDLPRETVGYFSKDYLRLPLCWKMRMEDGSARSYNY